MQVIVTKQISIDIEIQIILYIIFNLKFDLSKVKKETGQQNKQTT